MKKNSLGDRMKFLVDWDIPIFTSSDSAEWWSWFLRVV